MPVDSVSSLVVTLDGLGRIRSTNDKWRGAAVEGGATTGSTDVGTDYIAVCDAATGHYSEGAKGAGAGIRAVLTGQTDRFSIDYSCPTPERDRWFTLRATPTGELGGGAIVTHVDITELKAIEEGLRGEADPIGYGADAPIFALLDQRGSIVHVSEATTALLGLPLERLLGASVFDTVDAADLDRVRAAFDAVVSTPSHAERLTVRVLDGFGSWREHDLRAVNHLDEPHVGAIVVTGADLTDLRRAQIARHLESRMLRRLPAAVVVTDDRAVISYWNDSAESVYGYKRQDALGRSALDLAVGPTDERITSDIEVAIRDSGRWDGEYDSYRADGTTVPIFTTIERVDDDEIDFHGIVGASVDITERRALEAALAHQAFHDPLTGLPNRRLFVEQLNSALGRSRRLGTTVSVFVIDLDDFHELNETLGEQAGDEALRAVGNLFAGIVRDGDIVARVGGDEFVICCVGLADAAEATVLAAELADVLTHPFRKHGRSATIGTSIGIAFGGPLRNGEALLRNADTAMYAAKIKGKGCVEFFDDTFRRDMLVQQQALDELSAAINAGEMRTYFQPEVDLRTGQVLGFEALVRWLHPERGLLPPAAFIELAEDNGLIPAIGLQVLRDACQMAAQRRALEPQQPVMISVNVSGRQLADPEFPAEVAAAIRAAGIPGDAICLEVTETILMEAAPASLALEALKATGVKVAIDDFGTGYSSLSRLKHFPVDYLKIDRSFVHGLGDDPDDLIIVSSIIRLAWALGVDVIAEGIETESQLQRLSELGCDIGQGFLWSRPQPMDHAMAMSSFRLGFPPVASREDEELDRLARPLLQLVQQLTGLETSFITRIDWVRQQQKVIVAMNSADLQVAEGAIVDWDDSMCRRVFLSGSDHSADVAADFPGSVGDEVGMQAFFALPILVGNVTLGTVCGASRRQIDLSPETVDQLRLIAETLASQMASELRSRAQIQRAEQAEALALIDPLTDLANRRSFTASFEQELARSSRHKYPVTVLFIDVDHLKEQNDANGHSTGDTVLRTLGDVLRRAARVDDLAARLGGDEFALVLARCGELDGRGAAQRIAGGFRRAIEGLGLTCTLSIGLATTETTHPTSLLEAADAALYRAKSSGRDGLAVWAGELEDDR